MNAQEILVGRLQTALDELWHVKRTLAEVDVGGDLRDRVHVRLETEISKRKNAFELVRAKLDDGGPVDDCWQAFQIAAKRSARLHTECLAYLQGALARRSGLDRGVCVIGDALLTGLAHSADIPWHRFTILADREFFAGTAQIIRLRFPETSVWHLPLAAHEFGHYVGPRLDGPDAEPDDNRSFMSFLRLSGWSEPHLREYFSDAFAAYALGPSYAYACIHLRFNPDPEPALNDGQSHPAYAKRAHLVLQTLRAMQAFGAVTLDELEAAWAESMNAAAAVGQPTALESTEALDCLLEQELLPLLRTQIPAVEYQRSDWLRAERLASLLGDVAVETSESDKLSAEDTIADVLNASWRARADAHANQSAIGKVAFNWCATLARTPQTQNAPLG
jgi:hypothetical protein